VERAVEVHVEHPPPFLARQVLERAGVEDAGVAHDGVEATELVDRGPDDRLAALGAVHRVVGRDGDAARVADLADHLVGDARVGAVAAHGRAEVVHHDRGAPAGEVEGVEAPEPSPRAGHEHHLVREVHPGTVATAGSWNNC
jgi:hypothetical protein